MDLYVLRVADHDDGFALYGRRLGYRLPPFIWYNTVEECERELKAEGLTIGHFELYGRIPDNYKLKVKRGSTVTPASVAGACNQGTKDVSGRREPPDVNVKKKKSEGIGSGDAPSAGAAKEATVAANPPDAD